MIQSGNRPLSCLQVMPLNARRLKTLIGCVVFWAVGNSVAHQVPNTQVSPILIASNVLVDTSESNDDRKVPSLDGSELIGHDNSARTQRTTYRVDTVGRCSSWTNDRLGAPQTPGISCQPLEPSIRMLDRLVEPGRSFKIGHSVLELIIAAGLVIYSHVQLLHRLNLRGFTSLILIYVAAFTLLFHAFSVLMVI